MSLYQFLASEYPLPELRNEKVHILRGKKMLVCDSEEDLYELEILSDPLEKNYRDISFYTKLPCIYSLSMHYNEKRGEQLLSWLKKNCIRGKKCEVWSIRLANARTKKTFQDGIEEELRNLRKIVLPVAELDLEILKSVVDASDGIETPVVLKLY